LAFLSRRIIYQRMSSAVRDNTARSRFELDAGGVTAFMNYRIDGNVISLDHTETPLAARGRGLASRLVEGALQIVRARGLKVVPRCPFVRAYIDKHPEYGDLVR
jgi:predicted GNAT family acetyltransferase